MTISTATAMAARALALWTGAITATAGVAAARHPAPEAQLAPATLLSRETVWASAGPPLRALWPTAAAGIDDAASKLDPSMSLPMRELVQPQDPKSAPTQPSPAEPPTAPAAHDAEELAKKLQNPVANLISVPLQFNYDDGYGPKDAGRVTLNIQPVIPISLTEDWNLITRTILPVVYQDSPAENVDSEFGLGSVLATQFFSPKNPGPNGVIWGIGPAWLLPTATNEMFGAQQLALGPSVVLLKQSHGWTYGILANHLWTVGGDDGDNEVNATFLQPFLSYTWKSATSLTFNTESTYDWIDDQWTTPLNVMLGQLVKVGEQPVQFTLGGRSYAESPDDGPEWGIRFAITFLFPK